MSETTLPAPLTGIIPPLVSPLSDRDTLDVGGLERLVEHVIAGGVTGLFLLGTTGEGPSLSYRLRRELVDRVSRQVNGRVRLLVSISDTAFVESLNMARHAADCGADAVVAAPPYYMPEGQPELQDYLGHLLPKLRLPLFLYNMPSLTKVSYELETVRWAMGQPGIVGMKDSSGNMTYFNRVREAVSARPAWTLLMGPEELLAESVLLGGHGGVCGGANLFPRLYVELYAAANRPDVHRIRKLHALVMRVSGLIYQVGRHASAVIKGIKCGLNCLGICDDFMAEPFHRFRERERALIASAVSKLAEELDEQGVGTRRS